jgi:hypothetical protein
MIRSCRKSADGRFRYLLERTWDPSKSPLGFVMLNPSSADDVDDDPTARRCVGFAKREGAGGIVVANLFARIETDSRRLPEIWRREGWAALVGPANDAAILELLIHTRRIVFAWGAVPPRVAAARPAAVEQRLRRAALGRVQIYRLGDLTADGDPRHPLYLRSDTPLKLYRSRPRP